MSSPPLPKSKQEAFLESGLYARFSLEGRNEEELVEFFYGGGTLDAWCLECKKLSVFRIENKMPGYGQPKKTLPYAGLITIAATCSRVAESGSSGCQSPLYIIFQKSYNEVRKIGQSPSAADLEQGALDVAFNKELDSARRAELGAAIGLHAHGVGIGSFVYLRRILEALIEEAHTKAIDSPGWNENEYARARMSEKLQLLRAHLPSRLVETSGLYGILSKGVHELSERECLDQFALIKSAIELILKERHENRRHERVVKEVIAKAQGKSVPPT